ncbi:MAG: Gfo/Idh/MocA family oxidoreductase [Actinomycetota bacterium]|nr:Gfo/Idh/MocA family oxidoreductase [Actinomycetota bacterium]
MSAYSEEISVGVIGSGGMGTRHAETLSATVSGAKVAGVTDLDRSRAERLAANCGSDAMVFENEHALIQHDGIDAVVITSPDDTHAGLVMECLRHEKPVFCEKPLATTVEDARRIVDAEVELGRKVVQVGFMRRYDPQHLDVKSAIDSGAIGNPVLFKGTHRNLGALPGTSSESILVNSAVHDLDAARWMLGQEIEEVYVHGTNTPAASDGELLDLQIIQLELGGGCLANIEVYVNAGYGYEVDLEVVGDAGTIHIAPANAPVLRKQRYAGHPIEGDWLARFPAAYVLEMQRWIEDLRGGRLTGPDTWDGYTSLLAVESCIASLHSGTKEPLKSPQCPELYR